MIGLSVDRSSLGLLPLSLTAATGRTAGSYQLAANGWNPGRVQRDNAVAMYGYQARELAGYVWTAPQG